MTYSQYFQTGVSRDGARYIARWNGEYCGTYHCEKAALTLDKAARAYFCDGRYGAWRAIECGDSLPRDVESAFDAHHKAAMALAAYMGRA